MSLVWTAISKELQVTSPGEHVTMGQPLMTIYSPDLRAPEQELVTCSKCRSTVALAKPPWIS